MRPTTGQTVAEKVSVNEGTHGRLMRIRGPVNKDFCFVPFVALSEPTDNRETCATRYRQDFVERFGSERDQQPGFAVQGKTVLVLGVVKIQRTAPEAFWLWLEGVVIEENDDRYSSYSQVIEVELMSVPVLVANKKVAVLITQKLRPLAIF